MALPDFNKPPSGGLVSPNSLTPERLKASEAIARTKEIAEEQFKRLKQISKKVFVVFEEEKVTVGELPLIVKIITGEVNKKFDQGEISKVLKL